MAARVQEREGSITHWKIKQEDTNRQIADLEERHGLLVKGRFHILITSLVLLPYIVTIALFFIDACTVMHLQCTYIYNVIDMKS